MGLDHHGRWGATLVTLGGWLLRALYFVVGRTFRLRIVGAEHLEAARAAGRPVVLSFWHNRSILAAQFLFSQLCRRGFDVLVLASLSRDGELVTRLARHWGLSVVRGSASRGGADAVRAIYRAIKAHGSSPVMIPDGPRGPLYEAKIGVVILAQLATAPILPFGLAARPCGRLRSWDRLIVPWPFARITVVVGEPWTVPRGLSEEALEAARRRLEEVLDELTGQAEAALAGA